VASIRAKSAKGEAATPTVIGGILRDQAFKAAGLMVRENLPPCALFVMRALPRLGGTSRRTAGKGRAGCGWIVILVRSLMTLMVMGSQAPTPPTIDQVRCSHP
jgi:hypothetical protein